MNNVADDDWQVLVSFLSSSNAETGPGTDATMGMLKQMEATMKSVLSDGVEEEEAAIKTYDELMESRGQKVEVLTAAVDEKKKLVGKLGVDIIEMKEVPTDTENQLVKGMLQKTFKAACKPMPKNPPIQACK